MHIFNLPHGCVLLLATWLGQGVIASSPQANRLLKAAAKRSDLYKRSLRITKRFDAEVTYAEEENGWTGTPTFASQVKVNSQKPILNLEEVEHHLQDVQCEEGKMQLSFVDAVSARDAFFSCRGERGGLIITSHNSCNIEGERAVYSVHNASFTEDPQVLELSVIEASWQDAFDHFDISFGHSTDDHLFRRHSDFARIRKRQKFNVEIPADTPDEVTTGTFDLKSELIDTTFAAESFLAGLEQIVPVPQLPIEIGCKNCSTRGQVILTQGAIQIDASQIDVIPDFLQGGDDGKEITSVVTGGFIELAAMGVGAHIELFARPKVSGAFEIALFPLPVLGFVIPGIGKAGAVFEPRIAADFEISGGFELTYGIDVVVPDNSITRLELTDIGNSGITGFQGSTLTPLPFNVNVTDVDILLGLAFKPTIPVGFEFLDKLQAEVFVSVNLPRLNARLSTNAAADCGNRNNSTGAPYANTTTPAAGDVLALGSLALVEANVSITIDVGFGLTVPLLPPPFNDVNLEANIFSTVFPLVTECVDAGKTFEPMKPSIGANETATPCTTTLGSNSTVYVTSMKTHMATSMAHGNVTKTIETSSHVVATSHVMVSSRATASSHAVASSHVIKASSVPASSARPVHSSSLRYSDTTVISRPTSSSSLANSTVTSALISQPESSAAPTTPTPSSAILPAPTVIVSSGFLNSTGIALQQSGLPIFTGAAVPGAEVPVLRWGVIAWQSCIMILGMVIGVIML